MKQTNEKIYLIDLLKEAKEKNIKYYLSTGEIDDTVDNIFEVSSNAMIYIDGINEYGEFDDKALWEMINGLPIAHAIVLLDISILIKSRHSIINVLKTLQKKSIKLYVMSSNNTELINIDIELLLSKIVAETEENIDPISFIKFIAKISSKYFDSKLLGF